MAKSAAERQAAYRARRNDGEGDRRINTWVSVRADLALERLAKHYCVTKRGMLERLICETDDAIMKTIKLDTPEWVSFFTSIHPPGFHHHSPRHGALKWFVKVSHVSDAMSVNYFPNSVSDNYNYRS